MPMRESKATHDSICFVAKSKTIIIAGARFTPGGAEGWSLACTLLDWVASVGGDGFVGLRSMPIATRCLKSDVNAKSVNRIVVAPHASRTLPSVS